MTEEDNAIFTRLMNTLDTQLEVISDLRRRLEALEMLMLNHSELHSKEAAAIGAHNATLDDIGTLLRDFDRKLRQLNSNDATLQAELMRQREHLARIGINRPSGAVC